MNNFADSGLMDEMAEDANTVPEDSVLKKVSALAEQQLDLEDEVKSKLFNVANYDLPNAMSEVGLKEFTLVDGQKVTVKPYYSAKIDDDNREACHRWLEENGHADLIKHTIGLKFGKGESETVATLTAFLREHGYSYDDKEGVHFQTLTAFVREQVENGGDIPLDTFRVHIGQVTKIKR